MSLDFVLELEEEEREKQKEKQQYAKSSFDIDSLTCPLCYTFPRKSAKHLPCCNRMICSTCLKDFFQSNASQMLPSPNEIEKLLKKRQEQLQKAKDAPASSGEASTEKQNVVIEIAEDKSSLSSEEEDTIGPTCPFCRAQLLLYPGLVRSAGSPTLQSTQPSQSTPYLSLDGTQGNQTSEESTFAFLSKLARKSQRVIIDLPNSEVHRVIVGLDVLCPYGKNAGCPWIGRRDELYTHLTKECVVCIDPNTRELSVPISELKKFSLEDDEISLRERRDSPLLPGFFVPPYLLRAFEGVRPNLQTSESSNIMTVRQLFYRHIRLIVIAFIIFVLLALFIANVLGRV